MVGVHEPFALQMKPLSLERRHLGDYCPKLRISSPNYEII